MRTLILFYLICMFGLESPAQDKHAFTLGKQDFLLDGRPFQIISGEMHPARIPREYWRHRIQMAKAMGCNTIAVYVFWNYHEIKPGVFDFRSENRDIAAFIRLCAQEKMWVLLRPGPYVCAEWDFGGLPPYLLKIPDIRLRCMDSRYMSAVGRYIARLSREVTPLQCDRGGPIVMLQIENEYGSFGNDKIYLSALSKLWKKNGMHIPFYTSDGASAAMLEAGMLPGCAIGLDSGTGDEDFEVAKKANPDVPTFSSETYPGWLTHWKEKWQKTDTASLIGELKYLLDHRKSFNLYVAHGGTNFGFTAGANAFGPKQYQPDVTSYDYDAPINEQGQPTAKYVSIRQLIGRYLDRPLPPVPEPKKTIFVPSFRMQPFSSIWENLPSAVNSAQPRTMEALGQNSGLILYRTKLMGHKSGKLSITEPHDFAVVLLNGKLIDSIYRDGGNWTISLPADSSAEPPVLDILVEAMGHINFGQYITDRKGITDRVTLNGMTLMNWQIFSLPLNGKYLASLKAGFGIKVQRPGMFFKGRFKLDSTGDTYIETGVITKGIVWVNGHNLGRYWKVGPQERLYCPAPWLKKGINEVVIFDFFQTQTFAISGTKTLY